MDSKSKKVFTPKTAEQIVAMIGALKPLMLAAPKNSLQQNSYKAQLQTLAYHYTEELIDHHWPESVNQHINWSALDALNWRQGKLHDSELLPEIEDDLEDDIDYQDLDKHE